MGSNVYVGKIFGFLLIVVLSGMFIAPFAMASEIDGITIKSYRPIVNSTRDNEIVFDYTTKPSAFNLTLNMTIWNSTFSEKMSSQNHTISTLSSSFHLRTTWNASQNLGRNNEYNITLESMSPNGTIYNKTISVAYLRSEINSRFIQFTYGLGESQLAYQSIQIKSNSSGNFSTIDLLGRLNMSMTMSFSNNETEKWLDIFLYNQSISLGSATGLETLNLVLLVEEKDSVNFPVKKHLSWRTQTLNYSQAIVDAKNINESTIKVVFLNETSGKWETDKTMILDTDKNIITTNATHFTANQIVAETNSPPPSPSPNLLPSSSSSSSSSSSGSYGSSGSSSFGDIFIATPPKPKLNMTLLHEVYQKWARDFAEDEERKHLQEVILENERIQNKTYDTVIVVSEVKDDVISQIIWLIKTMLGLQ